MRETCLDCVLKHLGQAAVLVDEAEMGYPLHKYLAIGHMAEASSECIENYPELAQRIRDARLIYQDTGVVNVLSIIGAVVAQRPEEQTRPGDGESS